MKHRPLTIFLLVFVVFGMLIALSGVCTVYFRSGPTPAAHEKLNILVAVSLRPYVEEVADEFERIHNIPVERHYGASEDLLTRIQFQPDSDPIDIYIPADESYITKAQAKDLVVLVQPLARMKAVVLIAEGNESIHDWPTLLQQPRISLANENAAIGQLTREHLKKSGEWTKLEPLLVGSSNVSESANAVKIGAAPAAIVWEPVAKNYPNLRMLELPELSGIEAKIVAARLNDRDKSKLFLFSLKNDALLKSHHFTPITIR